MRAIGCVLLALAACATNHHVSIPEPAPTLTAAQRVQAFAQYRQRGKGVEWVTSCSHSSRHRHCSTSEVPLLLLGNGAEVRHAEDLLPILSPTSIAGRAARDVDDAQRRRGRWKQIAWGGFLGGLAMAIGGAKLDSDPAVYTGVGAMLLAPFVGVTGMLVSGWHIRDDTKIVFQHYDQGLAERFHVCVNGLAMIACELNTPGAPPPDIAPDPALRSLRQQ